MFSEYYLHTNLEKTSEQLSPSDHYILYYPAQRYKNIEAEIVSLALIAEKLAQKAYKTIFWIPPSFANKKELIDVINHENLPEISIIWLLTSELNQKILSNIKFVFTTCEHDFDRLFPDIKVATFNHSCHIVPKKCPDTIEKIQKRTPQIVNSTFNDNNYNLDLFATPLARPSYCFWATSNVLDQATILQLKQLEGIMPCSTVNSQVHFNIGYLRREAYQISADYLPEEKIILFMPTALSLRTNLDHFSVIKTLSQNFPDYTVWYRLLITDLQHDEIKNTLQKCQTLANVRTDEFIQKSNLQKIYREASILLTDLSGSASSFNLATSRPCIQFMTPTVKTAMSGCIQVSSYEEMVTKIKSVLSDIKTNGSKQQKELLKYMQPIGGTVKFITDNIEQLIAGLPLPDSITIDFSKGNNFSTIENYLRLANKLIKNKRSEIKKEKTAQEAKEVSLMRIHCDTLLRILSFMSQRKNFPDFSKTAINAKIEKIMLYYLDTVNSSDNMHKSSTYLYFSLARYLQLLQTNLPEHLSEDEKITVLDNYYQTVMSKIYLPDCDIQKEFYSYCKEMITLHPQNKLCRKWFINYLQSPFVNWMKTDNIFSACHKVYTIRALFWADDNPTAIKLFFELLSTHGELALRPYWFAGKWEVSEINILIKHLLNRSHNWQINEYNIFSQILLNIISETKDKQQLKMLLNGLTNNTDIPGTRR